MASSNVQHGDDQVAITIQNFLASEKESKRRGLQDPPYICVVPGLYRDQNPSCFDPKVISIGPIHRNVQDLEGLKETYLHDLLGRLESPREEILKTCFLKVLGSIKEIKEYYEEGVIKNEGDFELAHMMVTDACFILEFVMKTRENKRICPAGNRFVMNQIICDLVLLENQIPFFVLQDIFDCTIKSASAEGKGISLIEIILETLWSVKPFKGKLPLDNLHSSSKGKRYYYKHILDLLQKAYQPPLTYAIGSEISSIPISHSAVELDQAGVHFKPNLDGKWLMAIEYELSGYLCFHRTTLRMPVMNIHDKTELVLRNLIAYEQSTPINGYYFTSYACAMDKLVDTKEDIDTLVESKVIVNYLDSSESAANLFNKTFYGLHYEQFYYETQWKKLDQFCNRYWPKNIARLRRRYFSSPWNMIALVAVVTLFALNVIQTGFTIKSSI